MRFGSVCSGIEAASVAWEPLGWNAAWFSEIEPFPCAVLEHHYPEVPNLGDMTTLPSRILDGYVEAPDVFCGGTPCQAFSVAGKRQSLDDARGNLSLIFCEIANAIDDVRRADGQQPTIVFWENVPGVLSTKDNAFGCFLGELAGESGAIEPPRGKWSYAGCVYGPQRTVAWRVLDAQYFGVAQRRRRVFVVASARTDIDPAAILFEFDSLRRDTAPSRETWEKSAAGVAFGVAERSDIAHCLRSGASRADKHDSTTYVATTFDRQSSGEYGTAPVASTMAARDHKGPSDPVSYGIPGNWIGRAPENGGNAVEPMHDIAPCLTKADQHGVAHPMPINTMIALRHNALGERTGFGIGEEGDPAFTITKGHSHAVAYAFDSLSSNSMKSSNPHSGCNQVEVSKTLDTSRGLDPSCNQGGIGVNQSMAVRRLTPVECERLQGFPDNYTNIPWRKKPDAPDGPRYKALGNSWAVPNVRWIGQRIKLAVEVGGRK